MSAGGGDPWTLFFRNRHLLWLTVLIIFAGGYSALRSLPRLEDPVIANRNPLIITAFPGASADRVEAQVTEPIERALEEIAAIKTVRSTSRAGVSVVAIELEDAITEETNDTVFSDIRDRLGQASQEFPAGVLPSTFDDKRNPVAYTLIVGLSWGDGFDGGVALLSRQAEELADRLRRVPGTELVRLFGQPAEEVRVTIDEEALASTGLSVPEIAASVARADAKVPAGAIRGTADDLPVEVAGELDSVDRLSSVPILQGESGSATLRVGDIATIQRDESSPPVEIALAEQKRVVLVAARIDPDTRVDEWTAVALKTLEDFRRDLGAGIDTEIIFEQNRYTSQRLADLSLNLLLGAGVVFAVVLFTMGWRSALIVSTALPLTAALTLYVVAMQGGKLHQMSIFGMIIALGLLIDNAIVMTDEIRRHLAAGAASIEAVRRAVQHLFIPLASSTLTTILAFLPIALLPGNAGDFVGSISGSVIIALACSFFISLTIIAGFAGLYGAGGRLEQRLPNWLNNGVGGPRLGSATRKVLQAVVCRPVTAIALSLIIPLTGFGLATTLGSQFFPRTDRNMFEIEVWMPTGTSISRTRSATERIEAVLRRQPEVTRVHWLHGASFPPVYYNLVADKDNSSHYAQAIVEATDAEAVSRMITAIQDQIDREVPEAQAVVQKFAQGPPAPADVEIRLMGPDVGKLQQLGETVRRVLASHPGVLHTQMTIPRGEPKLWVEADEEAVRLAGLSLTEVATQLQAALDGVQAGTILEGVEQLPVRIRYADDARSSVKSLQEILIQPETGEGWIPLSALAMVELRPEQGGITRRNGERSNSIYGFARDGTLPIDITNDVLRDLEESGFELPIGYRMEVGGEAENQGEALGNLLLYLPVIVALTIATLVLSFRSVAIGIILLVVAPLSVGFGLLSTWAWGLPLSFNTIIGSLGLMGLAFNSSIIVLAAIRSNPDAASGNRDAIVDQVLGTCRHLVSTTLTTIGSFLPILIFIGGQFWPPLAVVLAGGVGGSTLLALVFTPAAYALSLSTKTEKPQQCSSGAPTGDRTIFA